MKKRKLEVVLIFAGLAIVVFWVIGYLWKWENVLPEEDDILTMKAVYYTAKGYDYEFTVEKEYFADIINELRPAQKDFSTAAWVVLGKLYLSCKNQRSVEVSLYSTNEPLGAFSVEGAWGWTHYRAGNSWALNNALEAACEGSKDKKKIVPP
jgi:hypothetical protein